VKFYHNSPKLLAAGCDALSHPRSLCPILLLRTSIAEQFGEVGILIYGLFAAQSPRPPMPLSTLQETSHDVPGNTRGQDEFATSFPVRLCIPYNMMPVYPGALPIARHSDNVSLWARQGFANSLCRGNFQPRERTRLCSFRFEKCLHVSLFQRESADKYAAQGRDDASDVELARNQCLHPRRRSRNFPRFAILSASRC